MVRPIMMLGYVFMRTFVGLPSAPKVKGRSGSSFLRAPPPFASLTLSALLSISAVQERTDTGTRSLVTLDTVPSRVRSTRDGSRDSSASHVLVSALIFALAPSVLARAVTGEPRGCTSLVPVVVLTTRERSPGTLTASEESRIADFLAGRDDRSWLALDRAGPTECRALLTAAAAAAAASA